MSEQDGFDNGPKVAVVVLTNGDGANPEPLLRLAKYPNFYLKIATRNFQESNNGKSTTETMFKKLVSEFGANRMAWGSNFPASKGSLKDLVELAKQGVSSLSKSDQEWILGKTALHLYPALAKQAVAA